MRSRFCLGALVFLQICASVAVQAQSIRPAIDGTGTLTNPAGNTIDISGGSLSRDGTNLFHSFQQFGLTQGQIANFLANPAIRNILGRVVGGEVSVIDGLVRVSGGNANLFLMNPAGIIFGANARLDLAGDFTATTATRIGFGEDRWFHAFNANDYSSLVGTPGFFMLDAAQSGSVINLGQLSLQPGRNLLLLGQNVINAGQLAAPGGSVTIAAIPGSNRVRISRPGNLLSLEVEAPTTPDGQLQPFTPADLPTLLTTGAAGLDPAIANVLPAAGSDLTGIAIASGSISVAAPNAPDTTPQIAVVGDRVALLNANLDASAPTGGGTIRIGGDFRGQGTIPNATRTVIDRRSVIRADGLTQGNGGQVSVWSEGTTSFSGTITARGGAVSGNGGLVEVSGRQNLIFRGITDLSAANGQVGNLILDPENIVIVNGAGAANDGEIADGQILANELPGATFTISEQALQQAAATATVRLEASNNITINDLVDNALTLAQRTGAVEFIAGGTFEMADASDRITTAGAGINISANRIVTGGLVAGNAIQLTGDVIRLAGGAGSIQALAGTRPSIVLNTQNPSLQMNVEPTSPNPYNDTLVDLHENEFLAIQQEQFSEIVLRGGNVNFFAADNGVGSRNLVFRAPVVVEALEAVIVRNLDSLVAPSLTVRAPEFSIQRSTVPTGAIQVGALNLAPGNALGRSQPQRVIVGGTTEPLVKVNSNDPINPASTTVLDITQAELAAISTPSFTISTPGDIEIVQPIAVNSNVRFDGANVFVDANVTATGNISFAQNLVIRQDAQIQSTGNGVIAIGQDILATGSLSVSAGTVFTPGAITSAGSDINFALIGDLTLRKPVITNGGDFAIATSGSIQLLDTVTTTGGDITLLGSTVTTNRLDSSNPNGQGGAIAVTATTGTMQTQDLDSSGRSGGAIGLNAAQTIQTGTINASGSGGNGGNVSLRSPGDIQVTTINAQGSPSDRGGNVSVSTDNFFRATGTFLDQTGTPASISTIGGSSGGNVTIQHGGGDLGIPFVVGDASRNGTAAAITTGRNNTLSPERRIPGSLTRGNIRIITKDNPNPQATPELPNCFPNCGLPPIAKLPAPELSKLVFESLEGQLTQEYETALGRPEGSTRIKTLEDTKQELREIEQQTGLKSALIYVGFLEPGILRDLSSLEQLETRARQRAGKSHQHNDELHVLVITSAGILAHRQVSNPVTGQPITYQAFKGAADDLYRYVAVTAVQDSRYVRAARDLYEWLIRPIETQLQQAGTHHLSFLVSRSLPALPFPALLRKEIQPVATKSNAVNAVAVSPQDYTYLIEAFSVSLMPSFSLVDAEYKTPLRDQALLAMGIETFSQWNLGNLHAVHFELEILKELWQGNGRQFFSYRNAQVSKEKLQPAHRQLLREQGGQPIAIVHLTTHAEFRDKQRGPSYIQFMDERLLLHEMPALKLNNPPPPPIELLVLSACKTALGGGDAELGFAGQAAQSRVKSVIASLWEVNHRTTFSMLINFYQNLQQPIDSKTGKPLTKARALQLAQLDMRRGNIRLDSSEWQLITAQGKISLSKYEKRDANESTFGLISQLSSFLAQNDEKHEFTYAGYWSGLTLIGNPW